MESNSKILYLDNAATSWPKPENVYKAAENYMRYLSGNPGRSGSSSLEAERFLYNAREKVASFFQVKDPSRIVFCYNATDALNTALKGLLEPGDHVIYTAMEHNSVLRPLGRLRREGIITTTMVPCNYEGDIDLDFLEQSFQSNTRLVVFTQASNICGKILPYKEIVELTYKNGALSLMDAAQAAGSIPINASEVDLMVFTGHKSLMGPPGTGGLYVSEDIDLKPWREGGTGSHSDLDHQPPNMPERLEAGTNNGPGIAGLVEGINFIEKTGIYQIHEHENKLTSHLLEGLSDISGIKLFTPQNPSERVSVVSFLLEGVDPGELGDVLESVFGIISRTGLHCAPLAHQALGTYPAGTVRLSPGYFNTIQDIDYVIHALQEIVSLKL